MKPNSHPRLLTVFAATIVSFASVQLVPGYPNAPVCVNTPHFGNWICLQSGALVNPGQLTWTNSHFCLGTEIAIPGLTGAAIHSGLKKRDVTYDCDASLNHSETNAVSYTPCLYFEPNFRTVAGPVGTNVYNAFLQGIADGGCTNLGPVLVAVVTVVVVNPDADTSPPNFTITAPGEGANL